MLTPGRLAVASLGCAAAAVGLGLAAADSSPTPWDEAFASEVAPVATQAPWSVPVALVLRTLGSSLVVLPLLALVAVLLLRTGHRRWAGWLVACGLGGWLLTTLVKVVVGRERPPGALTQAVGSSFPSGHTTSGVYGWVTLGIVGLALLPRPWNRWLGGAAVLVGLLMGPSRWVLGVHWFTDVVGGWFLAAAWVLAVSAVALRAHGCAEPSSPRV